MDSSNKNNSILSISSEKIKDCSEVLNFLYQSGITCSITENTSVVKSNDNYVIEKGCRIIFNSHRPDVLNKKLWNSLQTKFGLNCAHLKVEGKFKGCINDYLRKSSCSNYFDNFHPNKKNI